MRAVLDSVYSFDFGVRVDVAAHERIEARALLRR